MLKIGILFGSSSNEHVVSVVSAASIIKNLDKDKYEVIPIYLNERNEFYLWDESINKIKPQKMGILPTKLIKISNPFEFLKTFDTIFIMIHGSLGEDGTIAHILDFLKVPYVGNTPEACMITMDKILTKEILKVHKIKTAPFLAFTKYNEEYILDNREVSKKELYEIINIRLKYPLFIKPSRSGSSIGITKINSFNELESGINEALKIDNRILIEEGIKGRELEIGIIEEDKELITSVIGEVKTKASFYDFNAKYSGNESKTIIPAAHIDKRICKRISDQAIKIFKILNCHGYGRCDFFLTDKNEIILNEINTIPGFTKTSMFPILFEKKKIPYKKLLDILITESLNK